MNTHEIACAWAVYCHRARRGEMSDVAFASSAHDLIASTSILDLKAQRYIDTVVKSDVVALESSLSAVASIVDGCEHRSGRARPRRAGRPARNSA